MPIYDYQCTSCDHIVEVIQKISDAPLTDCPECDNATLQKQVSAPSFRLSGNGWYETDFKDGNKKNLTKKDKPASEKKSTDKAAKKTTKPACKTGCGCH
ncbi:MAG: zinc ribbon domain-containing protein [Thiotrichaceae bacterium]